MAKRRGGTPEQRAALQERLKHARELSGHGREHSAADCAKAIGVEPSTYYRYEGAGSKPLEPSVFVLKAAAEHFGVSLDWLVRGDEEMPESYWEWRRTPRATKAAEVHPEVFPWIELRSFGYEGSYDFYDALLYAWETLTRDRYEAERVARETAALRDEARRT